jgi:hypothetical protein
MPLKVTTASWGSGNGITTVREIDTDHKRIGRRKRGAEK